MPIYEFYCPTCDKSNERLLKIEHEEQHCLVCGGLVRKIISVPNPHFFREGYYPHLDIKPVYCSSKRQLKEECKKRGLTSHYASD